ncbi:MAG: FAD:protein FMN transferase [Anaerotignaceae bacterium]
MKKIILFLIVSIFLVGCKNSKAETVTLSSFFLNTVSSITIYDKTKTEAENIISEAFVVCREYENILSRTIATSDISKINSGNGDWVTVSQETIEVIEQGIKMGEISHGEFDITLAHVSELWDFANENPTIPSENVLLEAISHVGFENIEIDGNNVRLLDKGAAIDLGGIAKGYIGDRAREFLIEKGVTRAIVNLGGNILTINPETEDDTFSIGIQRPFDLQNALFGVLAIKNKSVVTSGVYERGFEKGGVLYHHILDTKTGMPINNGIYSVTIIAESATIADGLSTACFALGLEEGMKLIEDLEGVECIYITDGFEPKMSSGINKDIMFELKGE